MQIIPRNRLCQYSSSVFVTYTVCSFLWMGCSHIRLLFLPSWMCSFSFLYWYSKNLTPEPFHPSHTMSSAVHMRLMCAIYCIPQTMCFWIYGESARSLVGYSLRALGIVKIFTRSFSTSSWKAYCSLRVNCQKENDSLRQ